MTTALRRLKTEEQLRCCCHWRARKRRERCRNNPGQTIWEELLGSSEDRGDESQRAHKRMDLHGWLLFMIPQTKVAGSGCPGKLDGFHPDRFQ